MSFRLKTVLGIACIEAPLLTILVISGLNYLSSSNATQLQQRAATTAKLVATMTGDVVIAVDLATLDVLVDQALSNPDLVYLRIRSANGTVLSEGGEAEALEASFVEDQSVEQARSDQRLDVSAPITVVGSDFGQVEIGLSTAALDSTFGNTPVQVIADNATFVAKTIGEIIQMVDGLSEGGINDTELANRLEAIDWAFVKDEIPQALADMVDGTGRVRDLIQTFKQLAKPDGTAISLVI